MFVWACEIVLVVGSLAFSHAHLATSHNTHHAPLLPPSPKQEHKGKFTTHLAKECQECVLAMFVVGLYQPPLRVGSLRVLHTSASIKANHKCMYGQCK